MSIKKNPPVRGIPIGPIGIVGMATFGITNGPNTITNLRMAGCVSAITNTGSSVLLVQLNPMQIFYSFCFMAGFFGPSPAFGAFAALAPHVSYNQSAFVIQAVGYIGTTVAAAPSPVCHLTIFGPTTSS